MQLAFQQGQVAAAALQQVFLGQHQPLFQFVQTLGLFAQLGAWVLEAAAQVSQFRAGVTELAADQPDQVGFDGLQAGLPFSLVGAQQFPRGRGGGGA